MNALVYGATEEGMLVRIKNFEKNQKIQFKFCNFFHCMIESY